MHDVTRLKSTIIPKSDQLNAEQLLTGPLTVQVTGVKIGSEDQPVIINYANDNGRPYKPCKTMRKVLVFAWGEDGTKWAGHRLTLYQDPSVRFGGENVGGVRISHMSGISGELKLSLTATKGKKAITAVKPLEDAPDWKEPHHAAIRLARDKDELRAALTFARADAGTNNDRAARVAFDAAAITRAAELDAAPKPTATLAQYVARVNSATSEDTALLEIDAARDDLSPDEQAELYAVFQARWPAN
jgi:hypothetical protein